MAGGRQQRRVLAATLVGIFVASFPSVILVAALPDVADDLGVSESSVGWVLTAPMIAAAVLVPLFGKLGDLRGHRRVFLAGFVASGVFAALSAAAWDLLPLVALRTLSMGAGVATGPTALALLMATHHGEDRPKALGAWALVGASSPVLGLLVGGPLIGALTWRGVFGLQAVLALVTLPLALASLPETPRVPAVRFDVLGGALLVVGAGSVVFALDRSAEWSILSPGIVAAVVLAPVALWAFVAVERRTAEPLLPLALMRSRAYTAPVAGEAIIQISSIGSYFLAPLVLTGVFDKSVSAVAYLLIPMPLGMAVFAPIGGRLTVRWGERKTSVAGCLLMLVSLGLVAFGTEAEHLWVFIVGIAVHGAAMGLNRPSYTAAAAGALDANTTGIGMAVLRMCSSLGAAAGVSTGVAGRAAGGFGFAYAVMAVTVVVALAASQAIVEHRPEPTDVALAGTVPVMEG